MGDSPGFHRGKNDEPLPKLDSSAAADDESLRLCREFFESVEPGLRAFLKPRLRQQTDVDDCLQVVFIKLVESWQQISAAARRAWTFRVAANESARMWRKEASTSRVLEKHGSQNIAEASDPADDAIATETAERLRRHLKQLPDAWQQIVRLRIDENLTFQQIADQLGIPIGTALTRMRRSLERLRSELDDDQI